MVDFYYHKSYALDDTNGLIYTTTQVLCEHQHDFGSQHISDGSKIAELPREIESILHWYLIWSVSHANANLSGRPGQPSSYRLTLGLPPQHHIKCDGPNLKICWSKLATSSKHRYSPSFPFSHSRSASLHNYAFDRLSSRIKLNCQARQLQGLERVFP